MPASAAEDPSIFDVSIIYNTDADKWPEHISKQLSSSLRTRFILDTDLLTVSPPIADSKVIIVIASNDHLTLLQSADFNHYKDVEADSGIIFMCGIDESHLLEHPTASNPLPSGLTRSPRLGCRRPAAEAFPAFSRWVQVQYRVTSVELKKTVDRVMATWLPSKVKLHPTSAHSEVPTSIVLSFTDAVRPVDATVDVLMSDYKQHGESICVKVHATRLNPYTYTFEAPEHRAESVGIKVLVNDILFSRSLTLTYLPTVSGTVKNVSCIYMHLINTLCSSVLSSDVATPTRRSQTMKIDSKADLDLKLSSLFDAEDSSVGIPVQAFEQLFGVQKFSSAGEVHDSELPTLIHLSAKYGLQELSAKLLDLPDAGCAFQIANESGQQPDEIARENNHGELADLLETFKETSDFGMYVTRYENEILIPTGSSKYYVNVQGSSEVQECIYMAMDKCSSEYVLSEEIYPVDENVYDDALVTSTGNTHTYMNSNTSVKQKKLIDIMYLVKSGHITQAYAEVMFRDWQSRYEGGRHAKSFKEKQAQLQNMKSFLSETKTKADSAATLSPTATGGRTISSLVTGAHSMFKGLGVPPPKAQRDSSSSLSSRESTMSSASQASRSSKQSISEISESEEGSLSSPVTPGPPQIPPRSAGAIKPLGRAMKK